MPKEERSSSSLFKLIPALFVLVFILLVGVGFLTYKVILIEKGGATGGTQASTAAPLAVENLKKMAKDLKLKTKDFNKCLDDSATKTQVSEEAAEGSANGVSGTPAFFVNNVFIAGAYPYTIFQQVIDFELGGGDWAKPDATVKTLVDKDETNGEITIVANAPEIGDAPSVGEAGAPVKIIEFSDFQCPYCATFRSQTYPQILANYIKTGKVLFAYKEYPLTFHAQAQKAAEAALCAKAQGKFWEMHDKMFEATANASTQ
jgi:protein-disulfide isomerase